MSDPIGCEETSTEPCSAEAQVDFLGVKFESCDEADTYEHFNFFKELRFSLAWMRKYFLHCSMLAEQPLNVLCVTLEMVPRVLSAFNDTIGCGRRVKF